MAQTRRAPRLVLTVVVAASGGLLTACSPSLPTVAAPSASAPACAALLERVPDRLGDLGRRRVSGAGTAAWGDPPITLFCGVPEPGPSTERCVAVGDSSGARLVDWLVLPGESGTARFVTFGRSPAIEVQVPDEVGTDQPTGYLVDLAAAIGPIPQTARCS